MDKKQLLALKSKIIQDKETLAKLQGKYEHLLEELKTSYGCKTFEEAQVKIKKINFEVAVLQRQYDEGIKDLEDKYELE